MLLFSPVSSGSCGSDKLCQMKYEMKDIIYKVNWDSKLLNMHANKVVFFLNHFVY